MAEAPEIDFTKIDFPSDGLTIRTLRRLALNTSMHSRKPPESSSMIGMLRTQW